MVEVACPKCGRGGAVPNEKVNTRLVCKKCYSIFYVNTGGRTMLGEPPHEASKPEPQRTSSGPRRPDFEGMGSLKESMSSLPTKKLGTVLLILLLVWGLWALFNQPPESLTDRSKITAEKFANDDLAYLKEIASADTVDDVVRWFDLVHPRYVKSREQWKSKGTTVQVMVIGEDRKQRTGEAKAYVYPDTGPAHSARIANAAATTPIQPVDFILMWTLDGRGRWRLNGQQTLQAASLPENNLQ